MSPLAQILAQANRPAPAPPQATIAPTNVAGIYANNDAQKMDAYKAQLAQQNAEFGGLASLGSAGIGVLGKGLFSSAPAAAAGATGGTSALSSLLPFMIA
jgi:hypothetical protein